RPDIYTLSLHDALPISNLGAGTYTVTVSDATGCTSTQSITITQPSAITAPTTQTNVNCNGGNNGTATVTASGGTPGYTYVWAPRDRKSTRLNSSHRTIS